MPDSISSNCDAFPITIPADTAVSAKEQEMIDWNAYYGLLMEGKLGQYGGKFIVFHKGHVFAEGTDSEELRASAARQLGVSGENLVVPFVDNTECLIAE